MELETGDIYFSLSIQSPWLQNGVGGCTVASFLTEAQHFKVHCDF